MFIIICIVCTFAQLFTKFARMYEVLINLRKIVYLFFPVHITACMLVKYLWFQTRPYLYNQVVQFYMSSLEFLIQIHGILFELRAEIRLELVRDSFCNTCPSDCTIKLPE